MTFPKLLAILTVVLFSLITVLALMNGSKSKPDEIKTPPRMIGTPATNPTTAVPIQLGMEVREIKPSLPAPVVAHITTHVKEKVVEPPPKVKVASTANQIQMTKDPLPEINRVELLFNKMDPKFPFVETIIYKSRVSWQKGRPAWLSDYASHYATSRHFIARSLNGTSDYNKQDVADGDRFNVFRKDKNITFHLLVDVSRSKLWFYAFDTDRQERYPLKTYRVSLGRKDENKASGILTPLGTYSLGSKIAIYKPKVQGYYNGQKTEMIRIFGTRWIPFDKEIKGCSAPAKSLGIHGVPWHQSARGELVEDLECLGKYESDGCIRLATKDIEEIFAIIITKPAVIELVADYYDAVLPGKEWRDTL